MIVFQVFSALQEKALVGYIIKCNKFNYGLSVNQVRRLAYQFAVKQNLSYPVGWNKFEKASYDWYFSFMNRNKNLSLRKPSPTSIARAKGFCKENVDDFFQNYDEIMKGHIYDPVNIWNCDETSCPTVPPKPIKVVAEKGSIAGKSASAEKGTNVTMVAAVSAAGQSIPPVFLFPRKNMQSHYMDNATPGAKGFANGSGYTVDST